MSVQNGKQEESKLALRDRVRCRALMNAHLQTKLLASITEERGAHGSSHNHRTYNLD